MSYFAGDEAEMEDARAKMLLDGNYVEVIAEKKEPGKPAEKVKLTSEQQPSLKKGSRKKR